MLKRIVRRESPPFHMARRKGARFTSLKNEGWKKKIGKKKKKDGKKLTLGRPSQRGEKSKFWGVLNTVVWVK